jgi:hypothetical protein
LPPAPSPGTPETNHLVGGWRRRLGTVDRTDLGLVLCLVALYGLVGGARFFSVDEVSVFQVARHWVTGQPVAPSIVTVAGLDGRQWNTHGPLMPLLMMPFYLLGGALSILPETWRTALTGPELANSAGVVWGGDPRIVSALWIQPPIMAVTVALYRRTVMALGARPRSAWLASLTLATATLLFAHSKNGFTHGFVALCLLAAVAALGAAPRATDRSTELRRVILAGAAAGLMVATRPDLVVVTPWLLGWAALPASPRLGRLTRSLAFGLPLAVGVGLVLGYNAYRFGSAFTSGHSQFGDFGRTLTALLGAIYGQFFSVGRSLFLYSPPLIAALVAFPVFARRQPATARVVLACVFTLTLLYSLWFDWNGGWAFGNRFLLPLVPLLALSLPWAFQHAAQPGRWGSRVGLLGLALVGLVVQVLGLAVNIAFVIHREGLVDHDPPDTYLFVPAVSQLAAHARALHAGLDLDPWLLRVLDQVGWGPALAMALPWLLCGLAGVALLASRSFRARPPSRLGAR